MLPKLLGMFAFVIWDRQQRRASAARDPYDIKPLYLAKIAGGVVLASQVKALLATGLVSREPDAIGQCGFWMRRQRAEPRTGSATFRQCAPAIACGSRKAASRKHSGAGTTSAAPGATAPTRTWRAITDVQELVREALRESVARHLVSDVPVACFFPVASIFCRRRADDRGRRARSGRRDHRLSRVRQHTRG